jgi:hypothetical protein
MEQDFVGTKRVPKGGRIIGRVVFNFETVQ